MGTTCPLGQGDRRLRVRHERAVSALRSRATCGSKQRVAASMNVVSRRNVARSTCSRRMSFLEDEDEDEDHATRSRTTSLDPIEINPRAVARIWLIIASTGS